MRDGITLDWGSAAMGARRHWPWLLLGGLWAALYAPVMGGLARQWWQDPNYGHGFFVPLVSGYLLWRSRAHWRKLPLRPSAAGGALMLLAAAMLIAGRLGAELFLARVSLLIGLAGALLWFAGWRWLRAWAFPYAFLFLMVPLPAIIYYQITFPLQLLASRLAGTGLDLLQVPALRQGNLILLPNYTMAVADACSGIRSLFSLVTLSVAYGYFVEPKNWKRIVLAVSMVPIAIISNGMRILGTGVLTYYCGPKYAEGFFHAFSGWLIFVMALGLMVCLHSGLKRLGGKRRKRTAAPPEAPMAPSLPPPAAGPAGGWVPREERI
ncbi:MAG TPA: exosortase/archaeosortase family protein [Terriglobales bacterium]|nr:exosortase/archaeosortase family protein [Terriglobales bacterium]